MHLFRASTRNIDRVLYEGKGVLFLAYIPFHFIICYVLLFNERTYDNMLQLQLPLEYLVGGLSAVLLITTKTKFTVGMLVVTRIACSYKSAVVA